MALTEAELKELVSKRGIIKSKLTKFANYMSIFEVDPTNLTQLQLRYDRYVGLLDEFEEVQDKIEISLEGNELKIHTDVRDQFEKQYFEIMANAKGILAQSDEIRGVDDRASQASGGGSVPGSSSSNNARMNVKLPRIELPSFSGSYEQWVGFYDVFDALINKNTDLPDIEKFYYLRSCLKDDAANVITSLEVSSDNYSVAWDLLKSRFENKKLMIHTHIKSIFDLETVHKESHTSLRNLLDTFNKNFRALEVLQLPIQHWDALLIFLVSSKLPEVTRKDWETFIGNKETPSLKDLLTFLTGKAQLLEKIEMTKINVHAKTHTTSQTMQKPTQKHAHAHSFVTTAGGCPICKGTHHVYHCKEFLNMSTENKYNAMRKNNMCFNCLKVSGHNSRKCSASRCRKCNGSHNTLVHDERIRNKNSNQVAVQSHTENTSSESVVEEQSASQEAAATQVSRVHSFSAHSTQQCGMQVILSTAVVYVYDKWGNVHESRCLLDSGSHSNFVSKDLADILQLPSQKLTFKVGGLNESAINISSSINATIKSRNSGFKSNLPFLVVNQITERLPLSAIETGKMKIPSYVKLADPNFHRPGKIDMLLGASIFWEILGTHQIRISKSLPILQETTFGWIISGMIKQKENVVNSLCYFSNIQLHQQLERFWNLEEIKEESSFYSHEEIMCEEHFKNTHTREENGRFQVSLPFRKDTSLLGDSKTAAMKRLRSMEKRFQRDPTLKREYSDFMQEYLTLDHMELVKEEDDNGKDIHYLAHHAVFKEESTTTKLRCVFDGSQKTSSGTSLNEILMIGPVVQRNLFSILIGFRQYQYAMTADIAKMYRQISVKPEDRNMQRILWRFSEEDPVQEFKLKTVTYGLSSSSFLATRCLKQLALENQESSPKASSIIQDCFYVDDLLFGADTIEEINRNKQEIVSILNQGQFELRKWRVSSAIMGGNDQPESSQIPCTQVNARTLGICWNSETDVLFYKIELNCNQAVLTKRTLLSLISQTFDPLGLVSPIIIRAKILMQELWKLKLEWDDPIPEKIATSWKQYVKDLQHINELTFPRHISCPNFVSLEIHGFSDSSEMAYGALLYLRAIGVNGECSVKLIAAKTRVAPLKVQSIPRLELCAALLLARLYYSVTQAMDIVANQAFFWSDSNITLSWIRGEPHQWKTFVGNRVSKIHSLTGKSDWRHVRTEDNPADLLSRGANAYQLADTFWQNGPSWLNCPSSAWPKEKLIEGSSVPEKRVERQVFLNICAIKDFDIFSRYSSLLKLQRVTAYILRFKNNALKSNSNSGPLTTLELENSLYRLTKLAQSEVFSEEIKCLLENKPINSKSKLLPLNTYLDSNSMLRVGGRLHHSSVPYEQKHPLILPSNHPLTDLIIIHFHKKFLHSGPQALLATIRLQFWPIAGKNNIKRVLRKCTICFKCNPWTVNKIMGHLPAQRTLPSRPFLNCGLDYAGPFNIKMGNTKTKTILKAYLCVFVCFSTKAVHLELVSDLTTSAFFNTLKRFVSRRGVVANIYSDNATNFIGANNELKSIYDFLAKHESNFSEYLSGSSINWHFIPARSAHMGGLWEASVKSCKYHLKRVVGNQVLTFEELYTVICQVESCLNSRPLCPMSENPEDFNPLTPAHFLIGNSLHSLPQSDHNDLPINRLTRYQLLTQMLQHFWTRWNREYLSQLQLRYKWQKGDVDNLKTNTLVILKEDNCPPLLWHMGRITDVHPGSDGHVRVVSVKTKTGVVKRAVSKVCPLPIND